MEKYILSIGYIPLGCENERISCGDPASSGTREFTIEVEGENIFCGDNGKSLVADREAWFNPDSSFWDKFTEAYCDELSEENSRISPRVMGQCWPFFQDEGDLPDGASLVSEDGDGGEFLNRNYGDGSHWYIRYQMEEDGEYFDETVLLIKAE